MSLYQISDIEKINPNWYDPNNALSRDDQQFICENTPLPKEDEDRLSQSNGSNINLNGYSATYKRKVKPELILTKAEIILKLSQCNYKTAPLEVALYLEILFSNFPSKKGHWLFIAQHYAPRPINRVISIMLKQHKRGERTIENPSKYFTFLIKFRKQRKSPRVSMVPVNK